MKVSKIVLKRYGIRRDDVCEACGHGEGSGGHVEDSGRHVKTVAHKLSSRFASSYCVQLETCLNPHVST